MGFDPISLGILAVGTALSIKSSRDQQKAAEKQIRAERQKAEIQNIQKTRQAIRAARLAQGAMVNQAALAGGMGSSGLAGGTGSIGSQVSGQLNYMQQIAEQNTNIFSAQVQGAKAQSNAAIWGAVGDLGGTIWKDMYKPKGKE